MSQTPISSAPKKAAYRPLSPHLQIWRWHITMAASILNRASGIASVAGLLMLTAWLLSIGLTVAGICPQAYTLFLTFAASPFGLFIWFGLTLAGLMHLAGGIRHLIWDLGIGFEPKVANVYSAVSLIAPVIATIAFWAYLFISGKVVL
jgi:succinate dehydrogenase / fumarate reductase, cytochrome b subunit